MMLWSALALSFVLGTVALVVLIRKVAQEADPTLHALSRLQQRMQPAVVSLDDARQHSATRRNHLH